MYIFRNSPVQNPLDLMSLVSTGPVLRRGGGGVTRCRLSDGAPAGHKSISGHMPVLEKRGMSWAITPGARQTRFPALPYTPIWTWTQLLIEHNGNAISFIQFLLSHLTQLLSSVHFGLCPPIWTLILFVSLHRGGTFDLFCSLSPRGTDRFGPCPPPLFQITPSATFDAISGSVDSPMSRRCT